MLENRNMGLGQLPKEPEYGVRQPEVTTRMMEAWDWLERQGLLIQHGHPGTEWFIVSSEGEKLLKRNDCFERWEKLGLDRVKSDLQNNEGRRTRCVGSGPEELDLDWEWVRITSSSAADDSRLTSAFPVSKKIPFRMVCVGLRASST